MKAIQLKETYGSTTVKVSYCSALYDWLWNGSYLVVFQTQLQQLHRCITSSSLATQSQHPQQHHTNNDVVLSAEQHSLYIHVLLEQSRSTSWQHTNQLSRSTHFFLLQYWDYKMAIIRRRLLYRTFPLSPV